MYFFQNLISPDSKTYKLLPFILLVDETPHQSLFLQLRQTSGNPALVQVKMGADVLLGTLVVLKKHNDFPLQRLQSKLL